MKKMLPLAGLLLLTGAGLNGDYNSGSSGCGTPSCPPKCPPPPTCAPCDEEAYGMPGLCLNMAFLPPAGPRVACGVDLAISADFIYWTARQEGLAYAATNWASVNDRTANTTIPKGSVKHPDFGFDPGFKVDLALMLDHDAWDVKAEYTWLFTDDAKDSTSFTDFDTSRLGPNWFTRQAGAVGPGNLFAPDSVLTAASTTWDLHFQTIDLNLGRNFFVSQYLSMRPHFGFKGTWQSQRYENSYTTTDGQGGVEELTRIKQEMDYWGFGIRTGFDTAWYFTKSWAIYGNVALSALWSQFQTCRRDTSDDNIADNTAAYTNFYTENEFHTIIPVLELGLGLRWEMWSCDDAYHFQIQAGWEEQAWWNMNQFYGIYEEGNHGNLNIQGFTLKFRFGF
ncbi:MAG: Lpg1974 family pore-forming outer membrane protein [Candidatus Algichlamydia australiensis]|nr:Lpg1974 family pore-forming outer membrane protein [Chlamydiales bacterium]